MSSRLSELVEEVTVHLAGLEITLTARRVPSASGSESWTPVEVTASSASHTADIATHNTTEAYVDPYNISRALEDRALRATTARDCAALPLPFLSHLATKLRSSDPDWDPHARVGRAFRAGVAARRRLDGTFCEISFPGIPFRNSYYVCLRQPGNQPGGGRSFLGRCSPTMAPKTAMKPLSQETVEQLLLVSANGKTLPTIILPSGAGDSSSVDSVTVAAVVHARLGGFMIVVPSDPAVHACLVGLELELGLEPAAFHPCSVPLMSSRGADLGYADVELVDLPWGAASAFFPSASLRSKFKQSQVNHVTVGVRVGSPVKEDVYTMAEQWINSEMNVLTAQEYQTAEEEAVEDPANFADAEVMDPQQEPTLEGQVEEDVEGMRQRIQQLESELRQRRQAEQVPRAAPPPPTARPKTSPMRQLVPLQTAEQDNILAELEKEVEEVAPGGPLDLVPAGQAADPMHQVLLTQLQQNAVLLRKLVGPKHSDPIMGLLSSNDSGSGSGSGSSVRGCIAREAFIRTAADLEMMAQTARRNALTELGIEPAREDGTLMLKYIERRMPIAEHKTIAMVAHICGHGWHRAFQSGNVEMMGILAKLLIFLEQASIDSGKLQLAWLLTGLQEPTWQILLSHRKQPGLQSFSRLASPAWIAANLGYLKELDFMETRLQALNKVPGGPSKPDPDEPRPKAKPKAKKGGGKGKTTASAGAESETQT
eukprot:Skav206695  [mRNA]  locus=scaffold99:14926:17259:+ [translate_table: standard]